MSLGIVPGVVITIGAFMLWSATNTTAIDIWGSVTETPVGEPGSDARRRYTRRQLLIGGLVLILCGFGSLFLPLTWLRP